MVHTPENRTQELVGDVLGSEPADRRSASARAGEREEPGLDLEAVRRREPEALGALFERYFDRIYAVAYRMLGNRSAAEDAAQEVFLKVHRAASTLDVARDPRPWLMTITTNVCRDHWRSGGQKLARKSASLEGNPGFSQVLSKNADNPETDAIKTERARLVQEALGRLRGPLREVIILREYEGLAYPEIAVIVGANETAVRKRYSRALAEMGTILKKLGL